MPSVASVPAVGRGKEWRGGKKYNKVRQIGKGAFATVYLLTDKFNGIPYAAKELEKRRFMKNGVLDQKIDMEMTIMSKIQHVRILAIFSTTADITSQTLCDSSSTWNGTIIFILSWTLFPMETLAV